MRRHAAHHSYTGLLSLIAAGLLALAFAACNGNGGSMDSGGAVYNPNGGSSGGSSGSSGSSGSGGNTDTFTAQDLLNLSNAGDATSIVRLVSGGGTSPNSKTVTMSAADLGLPADGTVTLTIPGIGYSATAGANPDGTVTFEVPLIETGTTVTIELTVQDAGGTILWYGSSTQPVEDNIDISLVRQFWTLPASILVTASPSAIEYDSDNPDSSYTRFSVSIPGLNSAPDGAVFTYSWKDQDGNTVAGATGSSLRLTAGQMLGAGFTPLNASETRTYSVEVTYTEPSGEQAVRTGSATVTIATEATLVLARQDGSSLQTESGSQILVLKKSDSAVPLTANVICYGGTVTYDWSPVNGSSATLAGSSGADNSVSPDSGGMTILRVEATLADTRHLSTDFYVYVLDAVIGGSDVPDSAGAPIIMTDNATDSTNLIASLAGGMSVSGVSYEWQVATPAFATVSTAGDTSAATVQPVATGETTVKLRASYKGVYSDWSTRPLYIAGLTVTQTPSGASAGDVTMALSDTKYRYASVTHGAGTESISWNVISGSIGTAPATGTPAGVSGIELQPSAGGKATVKVSTNVNGRTLSKTFDVYVFDLNLSGPNLTVPASPGANYSLVTSTGATSGIGVTASLAGDGMPSVTYTWTPVAGADSCIELTGSANAVRTVMPKAAGTASFTVGVQYGGTTITSQTVDVSVAGIVFTTFPKSVAMGGATSSCTLAAEVQGYSGTVNWSAWGAETTSVATVSGQTNSGSSSSVTLNALAGGKTKISVSATVGSVTLTAEKEIYILQLSLSCTDPSFQQPTATANGSLMLAKSDTAATSIEANLVGLPAGSVTYTWTPPTSEKLDMTTSGTGNKIARLVPKAAGNETVSVTATYDGESITKSVIVVVMDITLTSGGSPVTTGEPDNPIILKKDAASMSLTASVSGYGTGVSYSWSSTGTAIASVSGTGPTKALTPSAGGTSTVTVTATITATGRTLSKTVTVAVIEAVIKQGGSELASNSITSLDLGSSMDVTAELKGGLTASSWSWTSTPGSPAGAVTFNKTNAASVRITGSTLGRVDVTVTATYGGQQCSRTIQIEVKLVTPSGLGSYLKNLRDASTYGDREHPIQIPEIQGLTAINYSGISNSIDFYHEVYVDLSLTQLPEGITDMSMDYYKCPSLVIPPQLPSSVTNLNQCFEECTNLTAAPDFSHCTDITNLERCFSECTSLTTAPDLSACTSLTNMKSCFTSCTNLTTAPVMPASVTNMDMSACFYGCTSLTTAPVIPAGVTDMSRCFELCTSLTTAPVIPDCATNIDMNSCFYECTSLTTAPVIPANVTNMSSCFSGCTRLTGTVTINAPIHTIQNWVNAFFNVTDVTVIVPDCETKKAIEDAPNNGGVTVVVAGGITCCGEVACP